VPVPVLFWHPTGHLQGFTMFDFQRLRRSADISSAPFLAALIFLDVLNVFPLFLHFFSQRELTSHQRPAVIRQAPSADSDGEADQWLPVD
jgi:hypothetical protein